MKKRARCWDAAGVAGRGGLRRRSVDNTVRHGPSTTARPARLRTRTEVGRGASRVRGSGTAAGTVPSAAEAPACAGHATRPCTHPHMYTYGVPAPSRYRPWFQRTQFVSETQKGKQKRLLSGPASVSVTDSLRFRVHGG